MKKRSSPALILMFALLLPVAGQNPTSTQIERSKDDEDVVRITTNLIQVDVIVTDKNGKQVTDLRADEIEIQENGEEQKITNFSYVPLAPTVAETPKSTVPVRKNGTLAPPSPPVVMRPENVRRTIALVIDDLGLSAVSVPYVRRALSKFVDEQMQPGDFVAIMRTGGNLGIFQQFTNDRAQLRAAVERVRWNPLGRAGVSTFAPLQGDNGAMMGAGELSGASGVGITMETLDDFRNERFTIGTLETVKHIVQGLKELPGRKSVMLFSDGIKIASDTITRERVLRFLQKLTDLASRSSVVIYTMDARGVPNLELTAEDNTSGMYRPPTGKGARSRGLMVNRIDAALLQRRFDFIDSQEGLNLLAENTGGLAIKNSNDLSKGLERMLDDQQGYYLLGYQPNEETFDPARVRFNKIKVKVKRPGLKVRYRSGFYAVADDQSVSKAPVSRAQQLAQAISAPFTSGSLDVRLTALFANDPGTGSFLRSLLHVDANKLTFTEEPDGWHKFVFDIMAVTFGENGAVVDEVSRTESVRVRGETHRLIKENGFDYVITVPIKKPGAYQLRAALRDTATERVGTANQFIEVPDLAKNRLELSGIIVGGYEPDKLKKIEDGLAGEGITLSHEPQTGPGVRFLRRGLILQFGYVIYNARLDKSTQKPQLQTQIRLFQDGKQIFLGDIMPFDPGTQVDLTRLNAGGRIQLGSDMTPGDYVLQIIVSDLLVKDKKRTVSKWIDFQVSDK